MSAFHDVLAFVAQSRLTGLVLSPDGTRLVASVLSLSHEGDRYVSGLWEIDPSGQRDAVRLTGSVRGEFMPAFAPEGSLLFLSCRENSDPTAMKRPGAEDVAMWALPGRGEARRIVCHPGGITAFAVAGDAGTVAYTAGLLPDAPDVETHAKLRKTREDASVSAILYEAGPTRHWDRHLGPDEPHTFIHQPGGDPVDAGGQGLAGQGDVALSPDGTRVAYTRAISRVPEEDAIVVVIADATTGEQLHVIHRPGHQYCRLTFSADGSTLVCQRQREETYDVPWEVTLVAIDPSTGQETDLLPDFDNWPWPGRHVVSPIPGDDTLWFTGDEQGRCPIFRRDADGTVTRLTATGAYSAMCVAPDGRTLYALRAAIDCPTQVVTLDATTPDQHPRTLQAPGGIKSLPGVLTEVHATADDGFTLRAWLAVPADASAAAPAPLLVIPHGGPQMSWSTWSWQWNPWLFTARGYAVLLPDPALSTGYGQIMQERGHGQWGGQPYRDIVALTDAAQTRDDIDATKASLAGGSYGGYIAGRAATRTNRFQAIVSHAGAWNLEAAYDSDIAPFHWRTFGDPRRRRQRYEQNSPHFDVANVTTPMLIVHGGRDYRVPVAQGLELFQELQQHHVPVKFLYFPDEGHVITAPNHLKLWYETILNFLDHHLHGMPWQRPPML